MKKRLALISVMFIFCAANISAQKVNGKTITPKGAFIIIAGYGGKSWRAYAAGPPDANVGILYVHDYFGITKAAKESVERLGALGYRTIAIDLYKGRSATVHDSAVSLMNAKDSAETVNILRAGINWLKKPGRKLAAIGFSAGGVDAMNATLMEPELFTATIIVYGGGYDQIEQSRLDKLKNPVLAITGSLDNWPLQAGLHFLANEKDKSFEFFVYPQVDHGYAQPLFNGGRNYNAEATRTTWILIQDFLLRYTRNKLQTSTAMITNQKGH